MKRIIIIFILMAFISCRDKKNANNVATEPTPTDTEVAIATLKAFYSSVYNGSLDNQEVLFKQYVSKQLLEKIDELSADMTLDYDPFINGQDFFADVLNSTLKITPLENKNEYRCCFLLFGNTYEKETCVDYLLEKDKDGHFVISKILNDDILAGKRDVMPSDDDSDLLFQDEVHGNLFEQVEKTMDLLFTKYIKAIISYEGIYRVETYEYPQEAVREAIHNAIAHKDYSGATPIQISVYKDKIILFVRAIQSSTETFRCEKSARKTIVFSTRDY